MKKIVIALLITVFSLSAFSVCFAEQLYTGLIIDARELNVEPGKSPKVYDTKGHEIYGTVNINPDFVIEKGIVQYQRTIGDAIRELTAGDNPIVVRAQNRGNHPYKADVVISVEDAIWILRANRKHGFLEELNVVFVI